MRLTRVLRLGMQGDDVRMLQRKLIERGFAVHSEGVFDRETELAVRDFQASNMDQHGVPLVVDGKVGPLTWFSLTHPKPAMVQPAAIDFRTMPPKSAGGTALARRALEAAIGELKAGAGEVGGDNRGPFVRKYHSVTGVAEGQPWCASFVSWCYLEAAGQDRSKLPFRPTAGSRDLLRQLSNKGLAHRPGSGHMPAPGDLVFWWRESLNSHKGHVGIVHQVKDGMLYTIEGNRSPKVQGFAYVLGRMEKLLGFGHPA